MSLGRESRSGFDGKCLFETLRSDLFVVLPAWIGARIVIGVSMLCTRLWIGHFEQNDPPVQLDQGLLAWDGSWYRALVDFGYEGVSAEGIRFFPGYIFVGRLVDLVLPGGSGVALVVLANGCALFAMTLFFRLVMDITGDFVIARRSVWVMAFFPSAFVLAWVYAEALYLLFAVGMFLALNRRRWFWVSGLGAAAALTRPTGLLLAISIFLVVWKDWRRSALGRPVASGVALLAPPLAFTAFVWWASLLHDQAFAPLAVQRTLRGKTVDPVRRMIEGIRELFGPEILGDGIHIMFAILFILVAVVGFKRLPIEYAAFAGACLLVAIAAENLNSLERYALNGFPLLIAVAVLANRKWIRYLISGGSVVGLVGLTVLASLGEYVP